MAKKPSRATRKQIRERHERAQAHGLPGRALGRPSKPPRSEIEYGRRGDSEPDADAPDASETGIAKPPPTWLDKLKALPMAAKLGALVVLVLVVIGIVASQRKH